MQVGDDQGQLLTMMARLVGARRAVEVGTVTGDSSLCIARRLAQDALGRWAGASRLGLARMRAVAARRHTGNVLLSPIESRTAADP